jgi:hypothetical protein
MTERTDQAKNDRASASGPTARRSGRAAKPATVDDAKEAAELAVELVKEKLGDAVHSQR